ncbi:MAG: nucleotide exchange factor GrpE [Planctomycetes bacterium]|nr:nucleotide exchange factor GrpE [Planctomycetota bacterium]
MKPEAEPASLPKEEEVRLPYAEAETLRAAAARAQEYLDLAKRTQADFINYQTRARREQEEFRRYAVESFAREFLPVLDAIDRTLHLDVKGEETRPILEGLRIIDRELLRVLAKAGIRPMNTEGRVFDPVYHEAVELVPSEQAPESSILEEVRRGYVIHDRVLRPAQVRIAQAPSPANPSPERPEPKEGDGSPQP